MYTVQVNSSRIYDIIIEKNSLQKSGEYAAKLFKKGSKAAIITDNLVAELYLEIVKKSFSEAGFEVVNFIFPQGENSKNQETLFNIYNFLIENEITRSDFIVALGGGVVGDLAGFASATYLRSVQFIQIPTTFLAAVDSSVGGKTAINLPQGKNLIGAFHQPSLVICDSETFKTLDKITLSDGISETIKYGMIWDKELFNEIYMLNFDNFLEANIDKIIKRCVEIKRDIVEQDEFDNGLRTLLNFGHTLGHSIEKASNHTISHGQAVAIGMVLICKIGEKLSVCNKNLTDNLEKCLKLHNLPTKYNGKNNDLIDGILRDKKRNGEKIKLIFVSEIGKSQICQLKIDDFCNILREIDE